MSAPRPVFLVSDHTGITAEFIGKSLLSQFPEDAFSIQAIVFVDTVDKARQAAQQILNAASQSGSRPLVISSLIDHEARQALVDTGAMVMDIYGQFLGLLSAELGHQPKPSLGKAHGMGDNRSYLSRIEAVNYSLAQDDGLGTDKYARADLILLGVSRCGKTPTALYMAMQYGLHVANYPLTPEELNPPSLPTRLRPHINRLRGLTLNPERLADIRAERRPNSHYAALDNCRWELSRAENMMRSANIPILDTTSRSVEEIASLLRQSIRT